MPAKVLDLARKSPKTKRRPDLIWGSPPCQPFSNAALQEGEWDSRDGFPHFIRIVRENMPRLAVFENVAGLTYRRHADYLARVIQELRDLGYVVDQRVLNAADYKIPQSRRRLIVIGRLDGKPRWPKISEHRKSVFQALRTDGSNNVPGTKVVYTKTPTTRGSFRGGLLFNGRGRPVDIHLPSLTIYASGGNHVHWFDTENIAIPYFEELKAGKPARVGIVPGARRYTIEQMARLQGFPKDFVFCGPPSQQVKQIGNAAPPRMVRKIVKANRA